MERLNWDSSKSAGENAREKLPELATIFFFEGDLAADKKTPFAETHPFRLVTKRFRYTLEFFSEYYGPALKSRIESLKDLQTLLGEISDCASTQKLLAAQNGLADTERKRLHGKIERLAHTRAARFRREWKKNFTTAGARRSWLNYLKRTI